MSAPPSSFSDLIHQHPVLALSSLAGALTVARKMILKSFRALLSINRAFCRFLLEIETTWQEYREARPRTSVWRKR